MKSVVFFELYNVLRDVCLLCLQESEYCSRSHANQGRDILALKCQHPLCQRWVRFAAVLAKKRLSASYNSLLPTALEMAGIFERVFFRDDYSHGHLFRALDPTMTRISPASTSFMVYTHLQFVRFLFFTDQFFPFMRPARAYAAPCSRR